MAPPLLLLVHQNSLSEHWASSSVPLSRAFVKVIEPSWVTLPHNS